MWRRFVEVLVKRIDQMEGSSTFRNRGRLRKTIGETIKKRFRF